MLMRKKKGGINSTEKENPELRIIICPVGDAFVGRDLFYLGCLVKKGFFGIILI
jgi:hypothetical protein